MLNLSYLYYSIIESSPLLLYIHVDDKPFVYTLHHRYYKS